MGVRTRHLDLVASLRQDAVNRAARDEAVRVVERWNTAIAAGHDVWWSPTIRAALVAGMPYADVFCPGCRTSRSIDLRFWQARANLRRRSAGWRRQMDAMSVKKLHAGCPKWG
jgi:hypothetical protein